MSIVQTFMVVTGFCIALLAIYAAVNESDAGRTQQQASVWLYLEFQMSYRGFEGDERLEILLLNTGIGPARVKWIRFSNDEKALGEWNEVTSVHTDNTDRLFSYSSASGRVLRPCQSYPLLSISAAEIETETIRALHEAVLSERLVGELCYCSVFDECWDLDTRARSPTPARSYAISKVRSGFLITSMTCSL